MKGKWGRVLILGVAVVSGNGFVYADSAAAQSFKDVSYSDAYGKYILELKAEGAIDGAAEGMFHPKEAVTRAEFVKMLVAAFQLPLDKNHFHFEDLDGHWAAVYVQTAWSDGIVAGVSDYRFAPDAVIKREEAAAIVWRYLKANGVAPAVQAFMLPTTVDSWATEGVAQAMAHHLFGPAFADGSFRDDLSREEAAALIDLSMKQLYTAKTPDGQVLSLDQLEPVHLKDIDLTLGHQVDPVGDVSLPNHSSVIGKEELAIPAGNATLVKLSHDRFTAASEQAEGTGKTETVYSLYLSRPFANDASQMNTYLLTATVTGDDEAARTELLQVAETWRVPGGKP